jgi:hypothetical protein
VPAGEFAPHSVTGTAARDKQQNAFVVPYRDGDHTAWMEEHQVARAYRERFAGQQRHDQALTDLWTAARDLVVEPVGEEAWVIFAAQPIRPMPRLAGGVARADVPAILLQALAASAEIRARSGDVTPVLYNVSGKLSNARRGVYVQLGHDGSVVIALNVSTMTLAGRRGVHVVNAEVIDVAAGEFIALVQQLGRQLYIDSPFGVRAGLTARDGSGLPYECASRDDIGPVGTSRSSRTPRRTQPWTTEIVPSGSVGTARAAAEELSSALLNQFGVTSRWYRVPG